MVCHRARPLQKNAAQQHQQAAQHKADACKAEDGGSIARPDGKQAVAQLDERERGPPQNVAEDGQQHGEYRGAEDLIQFFCTGSSVG